MPPKKAKKGTKKKAEDDTKKEEEPEEEVKEKKEEEDGDKKADAKKESDKKEYAKDEKTEDADDKDDKKRKNEDGVAGTPGSPVGKRARKSSAAYKPDDFMEKKNTINIIKGRGAKLKDIPSVKACIEKTQVGSDVFVLAFRFLGLGRGKLNKSLAKRQMLDFCGYLPEQDDGVSESQREEEDEEYEVSFWRVKRLWISMLGDF